MSLIETLEFPATKFRSARYGAVLALKDVKAQQQKWPTLWKYDCQRKTLFFILIYRNSRAFGAVGGEKGKKYGVNKGLIRTFREDFKVENKKKTNIKPNPKPKIKTLCYWCSWYFGRGKKKRFLAVNNKGVFENQLESTKIHNLKQCSLLGTR